MTHKASTPRRAKRQSGRPPRGAKVRAAKDELAIAHEEEELFSRVTKYLSTVRLSQPPPRNTDDDALLTLRDQVATAKTEDIAALVAQMTQVSAVASQRNRTVVEPVDPKNPYFGHLRLSEKDRGTRDVLIGKTTHVEPRKNIRIVDWRHAPVSQLYYRYGEGARYEERFGDRDVEGKVLARRTLTISDGQLERIKAPQGTFVRRQDGWKRLAVVSTELAGGEGSAVRAEHLRGVLGAVGDIEQREDRHLPEIAALLDPRQFDLIAQPDSGLVIIQGGAGSGKTTIGVHRMAYLAYQSKTRFAEHRMLVVVGTPALRDYIGQLLGALGLEHVAVVTFDRWARKARERAFDWLRPRVETDTPAEASRLKSDPAILDLLEQRALALRAEGRTSARDAAWLWADVLTDREGLVAALTAAAEATGRPPRLTAPQLDRAWQWCSDRCPAVVDWRPPDPDEESDTSAGVDGLLEEEDERATLDPEDDALLLRAYQLVRGPLRQKKKALQYEHLFVDEAQDLPPIAFSVLGDIVTEEQSITLAGDTAQRLHVDTGFEDWSEVLNAIARPEDDGDGGEALIQVEPLRIAYRSTREVLAFARAVLGPLAEDEEPEAPRSGAPVEHHQLPTTGAAAAFLAEALRPLAQREPYATVAILARYPEQADAYYDVLKVAEVPNLRRVSNYDFTFRPGVEITEIRQVKGLEFDYVVLVDVNASSYPDNDEARYQLHIGATRAAHQLWVVSTGPRSPLIPDWLLS
ncbi:MAG: AAA family ATPase [Deltaproteobacteria bacterium]|nr:AAA family ATPase [Deltaproteobacteria bacterium]